MENKIVFAGLLHDIGKLIQRAEGINKSHSLIGVEYLNKLKNELLKDKSILNSIKYHHAKNLKDAELDFSDITYIIYEADNIASGIDRKQDIDKEQVEFANKYEKFDKVLCLSSVFNNIKEKTSYIYKLRDFKDSSPNYPENDDSYIAPKEKYQNLKLHLDNNIEKIKNPNSLLQLLESIMGFIPSSTDTTQVADISLYDHSKLTAAIASCMYQYLKERNISNFKDEFFNQKTMDDNRKKLYYRLVSFDMSGIQNFIYTITSKNALKSLRARSFYLEFLMEHIQDELLNELNLSRANILYSGGGHSYLLLPNTEKAINTLNKVKTYVNDWFIDNFSTELYLAYSDVECSSNDLIDTKIKFRELSAKLSKSKLQRYTNAQLEKIFTLDKNIDDERECRICKKAGNLNSDNICEFCQNLINLGGHLVKDKDFVIVVSNKLEDYSMELPTISNTKKYFKIQENKKEIKVQADKRYYAINDFSIGEFYATNIWMGDYCLHKENNEAYTFEDYINNSTGIKRLGVLRADVDNLGSTFTKGFNNNYSSISRYATLSRMLNMFYKRYINYLCENKKLAIVYSGGDDVFVIGAWADVLNFARELNAAFKRYSCNKLTLSAGIGFFTQNYPISKMAELTGNLEDFAKSNKNNTKNSIALFGENKTKKNNKTNIEQFVYTWDEFDKILELQKFIEDRCYFEENKKEDNKVFFSTALIYRIMALINSSDNISLARFAYALARIENGSISFKELKAKLYEEYQNDKKKLLTALNLIVYKNRRS